MTIDDVAQIMSHTLYTVVITAAPILFTSLVIGLLVSIFQTVTSIQEQTLTFVPKVLGVFTALIILGHWMLNNLVEFLTELWGDFSVYIK